MESIMSHQLLIFTCIAVLAAVTINADEKDNLKKSPGMIVSEIVSKQGFLIGERTPVWLAKNHNNGTPIVYERLRWDKMKRAMMMWRAGGGHTIKLDPSIDGYAKKKRAFDKEIPTDTDGVINLSIFVVMDYEGSWSDSGAEYMDEAAIGALLIYAMAFWNSVDLHLRFLEPKVRIRIAGIVIGEDRSATPYIYNNHSPIGYYDAESAILSMQKYWSELSETNKDFPKTAYDLIVTLTELEHREKIAYNFRDLLERFDPSIELMSTIIKDDGSFSGVRVISGELIDIVNELPLSESQRTAFEKLVPPYPAPPYLQFQYFSIDSKRFYYGLSDPKEYHDPGKPLETILPGQVLPALLQCKARNSNFDEVCWGAMTCNDLECSGKGLTCHGIGTPLDGTTCGKNQMCLAGKCISQDTLPMH